MARRVLAPGLLVVAVLTYLPVLAHGGFVIDDWASLARIHEPSPGLAPFRAMLDVGGSRVLAAAQYSLTAAVLGNHPWPYFVLALAIAVGIAVLLFAILRSYGLPAVVAGGAATLSIVLPASDVSRAWTTLGPAQTAVLLYLGGLLVAHRALRERSPRLHALSLALYLAAVFEHEQTLPLVAGSVLLYLPVATWRDAVRRGACDLLVALLSAAVAAFAPAPAQTRTPSGQWLDHGREFAQRVANTLWDTFTLYRTGPSAWAAAALVAVVAAAIAVLATRGGEETRRAARTIAIAGALSAAAVALAYAIYVPANPALLPDLPGPLGRVSVAAVVPLAVFVAVLAWGAVLALTSASPRMAPAALGLALAAICVGSAIQTHSEMEAWGDAARAERSALHAARAVQPAPPRGAVFLLLGAPSDRPIERAGMVSSVTVLNEAWVTTSALRVTFGRNDVFGVVVRAGDTLACERAALILSRPGLPASLTDVRERGGRESLYGLGPEFHTRGSLYNVPAATYPRVVLVRLGAAPRAWVPRDAADCRRAVAAAQAGGA